MAGQPFFESGSKSGWPDFSPDDYPLYLNLENFTYGTKGNGKALNLYKNATLFKF